MFYNKKGRTAMKWFHLVYVVIIVLTLTAMVFIVYQPWPGNFERNLAMELAAVLSLWALYLVPSIARLVQKKVSRPEREIAFDIITTIAVAALAAFVIRPRLM